MEKIISFHQILKTIRQRKHSLQWKIFGYFLIFSLTLTFTGSLLVTKVLIKNYEKSLNDHAVNSSNEAKQAIEFLLTMTNNTASLLATNQELLDTLRITTSVEDSNYLERKKSIDIMLKNVISVHEYIDNIYVLGNDGEFFSSYWIADQGAIQKRFEDFIQNQKKRREYLNGEPLISFLPFFDLNVISYTRPVFQYPEDLGLGIIIIDLNYTFLREMFNFSSLQQEEKTLVINSKGEVIFTFPFNTSLEHIVKDYPQLLTSDSTINGKVFGRESILLSGSIAYSDWRIIRIISKENIYLTVQEMTRLGIIVWTFFIILSFAISYLLSISVTNPIIDLNDTMKQVQNGNLDIRAAGEGDDEIGQLSASFNHMVERISELMEKALREQKQKSDLEFQILQSQINPHFLYNTLDSIKWLAVFQNVENISDMVTSLINLLKYNISKKTKLVTLSDEINSVKDYIEIQKFRFGDAFEVIYEIDSGAEDFYILKFILQPLVENCLFHGFDNIEYQGIIRIRAERRGDRLFLQVIDNGKGFDSENSYLAQSGSYDHKKMHHSIGIRNVVDRLNLYFGDRAEFSSRNGEGEGVEVSIVLPLIEEWNRLDDREDQTLAGGDRS